MGKQQHVQKEYTALINGINNDLNEAKNSADSNGSKEEKISELKSIGLKTYQSSKKPKAERTWRTREDPFKDVWKDEIEPELVKDRNIDATYIMNKLIEKYHGKFHVGQLRTLQRGITKWRKETREKHQANAKKNDILFTIKAPSLKEVIDNNFKRYYSLIFK